MIVAAVSQLIDDSDDEEDDLEALRRAHRQQLGRGSSDNSSSEGRTAGTVRTANRTYLELAPPPISVPELVFERAQNVSINLYNKNNNFLLLLVFM